MWYDDVIFSHRVSTGRNEPVLRIALVPNRTPLMLEANNCRWNLDHILLEVYRANSYVMETNYDNMFQSDLILMPQENNVQSQVEKLYSVDGSANSTSKNCCAICYERLSESDEVGVSCLSSYIFCVSCLAQYIKVGVVEKNNITSRQSIRCPCFHDDCELRINEVEKIFEKESKQNAKFSSSTSMHSLLKKLKAFSLDLEIQQDPNRGKIYQMTCCFLTRLIDETHSILSK